MRVESFSGHVDVREYVRGVVPIGSPMSLCNKGHTPSTTTVQAALSAFDEHQ